MPQPEREQKAGPQSRHSWEKSSECVCNKEGEVVSSAPILDSLCPFFGRAMRTAVKDSLDFYSMANHAAATVLAGRSQLRNGTLKAIKCLSLPTQKDLKGLIVVIPTPRTLSHSPFPFLPRP